MKYTLIIIFVCLIFKSLSSQPSTMLTFRGGYTHPTGDFYGKFGDTRATFTANPDSNSYFFRYGTFFGLNISYAPYKSKMLYFIGGFNFNRVWQNTNYPNGNGQVTIAYNMNILNITAGAGYRYITRTGKFIPFADAQFSLYLFTGGYSETYADETSDVSLSLNPTVRAGIEGTAGIEYRFNKRVGFQLGAKYVWANIIGKNSSGDDAFHYSLNDKNETVNGYPYRNRNITYLLFFGGVTFYLGM
jgi:hypothetical protein